MMKTFLLLLSTLLCLHAFEKNDFAYEKKILLEKSSGAVKFKLSSEIYHKLVYPDLSDLAVFDKNGQLMPKYISGQELSQISSELKEVPFIKFDILKADKQEQLRFEYQGAVVDMQSMKQNNNKDYIVDLRAISTEVEKIVVHSNLKAFMVSMDVECSQDLKRWKSIKEKAVIASLDFQNSLVQNTSINLPFTQCKYLRLRTEKDFNISNVEVQEYPKVVVPSLQSQQIVYKKVEDNLEFSVSKNLKIQRISFELEDKEQFYKLSVFAKNKGEEKYRKLKDADIYSIVSENKTLEKHYIELESRYDLYQIRAQKSSYLPLNLHLSYHYQGQNLYFIAQGQEPYILAFGSFESRTPTTNLAYLISKSSDIDEAKLSKTQLLAGEEKLKPKKAKPSFTKYFVWLSLFLGVLLLSFISLRLYQQLKEES